MQESKLWKSWFMWENSHNFYLSRANQRCPCILPTTLILPITGVRVNFEFRPLWNPTERTQTLTRIPYIPVSRALIYALQLKIQKKSPSAQWTVHPLNVDGGSKSYFLAKISAAKLAELTNIGFEIVRKDAMKKILYCNSPPIFSRIIYKRYEEY